MPFYGTDVNNRLDLIIDRAYSPYFSAAKRNEILRIAVLNSIDNRVQSNDNITVQDQLFGIYKTNQVFVPTNNTVSIAATTGDIADYLHLMNLRAKFVVPYISNYLLAASNASPIVVEFNRAINAQNGSLLLFSGASGNTNVNGQRYVKKITPYRFALYSDANLATPVAGNGVYSGTATASLVRYDMNYAKNLKSNRKFSVLNAPTPEDPFYEIGSGSICVYPLSPPCSEVTVDYISTPVFIDVNDSVTDLFGIYSEDFINFILQMAAKLIGEITRDMGLMQSAISEMQQP